MGELFCPVGMEPNRTCRGEGCAWWDKTTGRCAIFLLHLGRLPPSHISELEQRINSFFSLLKRLEERMDERMKLADELFRENLELLDLVMGSEEKRGLMDRYLEEGQPLEEFFKAIGVDLEQQPQRDSELRQALADIAETFGRLRKLQQDISRSLTRLKEVY